MKKILGIVVLATMFVTTKMNAQQVKYGVKGGVNLATFHGKGVNDAKRLIGFNAGLVSEYTLNEQVSIQPELLFSVQGAEFEAFGQKTKFKLSYLSLPIMLKYYLTEGLNIQAGPQISYRVSSNIEAENIKDVDVKKYTKKMDFALGVGLGYKINNVFLDARYVHGLSRIADDTSDDAKIYNGMLQFSVGFFF